MKFKLSSIKNIGHFFHENLFWAIEEHLKDNATIWVLDNHLTEWELQFSLLSAKHLNIIVEYSDLSGHRSGKPYEINQSIYFHTIMAIIQNMIAPFGNTEPFGITEPSGNTEPFGITEPSGNTDKKILYFRNETNYRRMLGYNNCLDHLFDKVVTDLSSMPFLDQVKLFMKCSHFVTIEGANLTNVIFMNQNAKVLDITPLLNSWQMMFGTHCCVDKFHILDMKMQEFHCDIQYNDQIECEIVKFLSI